MTREDITYRRTAIALYSAAVILNLWFLHELLAESEQGREILDAVKKPFRKIFKREFTHLHGQAVIAEAENILRSSSNG